MAGVFDQVVCDLGVLFGDRSARGRVTEGEMEVFEEGTKEGFQAGAGDTGGHDWGGWAVGVVVGEE